MMSVYSDGTNAFGLSDYAYSVLLRIYILISGATDIGFISEYIDRR